MVNVRRKYLDAKKIVFVLDKTLAKMRISMNQFSIESGIRPATVAAWCNGTAKQIDLITLQMALDTLNRLSEEYDIGKEFGIEDIFYYRK